MSVSENFRRKNGRFMDSRDPFFRQESGCGSCEKDQLMCKNTMQYVGWTITAIITLEFSDLICVHIQFLTARCAEAVLKYVFYLP